jgi:hypothetical protein
MNESGPAYQGHQVWNARFAQASGGNSWAPLSQSSAWQAGAQDEVLRKPRRFPCQAFLGILRYLA